MGENWAPIIPGLSCAAALMLWLRVVQGEGVATILAGMWACCVVTPRHSSTAHAFVVFILLGVDDLGVQGTEQGMLAGEGGATTDCGHPVAAIACERVEVMVAVCVSWCWSAASAFCAGGGWDESKGERGGVKIVVLLFLQSASPVRGSRVKVSLYMRR